MKTVNILECKALDCDHNKDGDCMAERIVIDADGACDDYYA